MPHTAVGLRYSIDLSSVSVIVSAARHQDHIPQSDNAQMHESNPQNAIVLIVTTMSRSRGPSEPNMATSYVTWDWEQAVITSTTIHNHRVQSPCICTCVCSHLNVSLGHSRRWLDSSGEKVAPSSANRPHQDAHLTHVTRHDIRIRAMSACTAVASQPLPP